MTLGSEIPVVVTCPCGQTVEHEQWCQAVPKLVFRSTKSSELQDVLGLDLTRIVVFFRNEDGRQRYVEFEPSVLRDLFQTGGSA